MSKRRTYKERVAEFNAILGKHPKFHFGLIQNARDFHYPYALVWNCCGAVERSLSFREMKQIAIQLHAEIMAPDHQE